MPAMEPTFRFCTSADGTRIAYAIYGHGPPLLLARSGIHSMDVYFSAVWYRPYIDALAARATVVTFDRRGTGASDRDVDDLSPQVEAEDIRTVADAAGLDRFTLMTEAWATVAGAQFAAIHPDRVERMILLIPVSDDAAALKELAANSRANWSYTRRVMASGAFPTGPIAFQREHSKGAKDTFSAETCAREIETYADADLDSLLAAVSAPALVIQPAGFRRQAANHVTSTLPRGELRWVAWDAAAPLLSRHGVEAIFEFMGLSEPASAGAAIPDGTAIILFTDIVDSTALTERMGDAAFRAKARDLDASLRSIISEAGGTTIDAKTLGDGVLATFPAASQAIDAATRCAMAGNEHGLPLHLGLHAGDVIREQNNVFGGAVNIASRISALSTPGEVLVSDIVRGLARTSGGVRFEDRGEHVLKGVTDAQRVYAVRPL